MSFEEFVDALDSVDVVLDAKDYEVLIEKRVDVKIDSTEEGTDVEELAMDYPEVSHVRTKEFVDGKISTYSTEKSEE